jgi:hypothetical protein
VSASSWIVWRRSLWMSSQFFQHILSFFGCPEHLSSWTDTRPALKRVCHSKTPVQLKECSPKASRSISRVSVADLLSFTQNLMQTSYSNLPSIEIKWNTKSKKHLYKNSACSQRSVMWQDDAVDLWKCDLRSWQQYQPGNFPIEPRIKWTLLEQVL